MKQPIWQNILDRALFALLIATIAYVGADAWQAPAYWMCVSAAALGVFGAAALGGRR